MNTMYNSDHYGGRDERLFGGGVQPSSEDRKHIVMGRCYDGENMLKRLLNGSLDPSFREQLQFETDRWLA